MSSVRRRPLRPDPCGKCGKRRDGNEREHGVFRAECESGERPGKDQEATVSAAGQVKEERIRECQEEERHPKVDLLHEDRVHHRRGEQEERQRRHPRAALPQAVRKAKDPEPAERQEEDVHEVRADVTAVGHPDHEEHLHPEREVRFHDVWQRNGMAGTKEDRRQTVMIMQRIVEERREKDKRQQEEGRKA